MASSFTGGSCVKLLVTITLIPSNAISELCILANKLEIKLNCDSDTIEISLIINILIVCNFFKFKIIKG